MKQTHVRLGLAALMSLALFGCGGGGSDGVNGPAGTPGTIVTVPVATPGINVASLQPADWAALKLNGTINSVTINNGPPVVTFTLTDQKGNAILGFEAVWSKSATAKFPAYTNFGFTLAKLVPGTTGVVPGTNGSPSRWVSYEVLGTPSTTVDFTLGRPGTENFGTFKALATPGQYQYTFYRDPAKVKATVDGTTDAAPNFKADLGDLNFDPKLTHRLGIQISGSAPGTGTNNQTATATGRDAVPLEKPINFFYDFIPATGNPVTAADTQREIVKVSACFECHSMFNNFHNPAVSGRIQTPASRQDTKMCVLCHTDQRKFGQVEATRTATGYSGDVRRVNGYATLYFPAFIHTLHMGEKLTKTGTSPAGVLANEIKFPQTITNCVKCHDGTAGAKNQTAQGDNWKTSPNRFACGACHDNVNFATGENHPAPGSVQLDDSKCGACHTADSLSKVSHVTVDPVGSVDRGGYPTPANSVGNPIALASQLNLPAGVFKIKMEIKSVSTAAVTGGKQVTVIYRILSDNGTGGALTPATLNKTGFLLPSVDGTPSIYVNYGQKQDGVAAAVDWTGHVEATVLALRDGTGGNSQTGPDANGYYTAKLAQLMPADGNMVTGWIGVNYNGFVQLNHPLYPKGIRLRDISELVPAVATDVRRTIVSAARCNSCHGQLGVEPSFHSGARNNPQGCATGGCHMETYSSHAGASGGAIGGWSLSIKNFVHGLHGQMKNQGLFNYGASAANPGGLGNFGYPGKLNNCEQCHEPGSFDFSNAANAAAQPNLLWSRDANADLSNPTNINPTGIGRSPFIDTLGEGQKDYSVDNLVSSPMASACFGCHNSNTAIGHMKDNGGVLYTRITKVIGSATPDATKLTANNKEACMVCHASGRVADIRVVHGVGN